MVKIQSMKVEWMRQLDQALKDHLSQLFINIRILSTQGLSASIWKLSVMKWLLQKQIINIKQL